MKKKVLASLLFVVLLIGQTAAAIDPSGSVEIAAVKQEKTNWCWAACASSILNYYGKKVSQTDFVKKVKGNVVDEGATDSAVQSGLENWGVNGKLLADYILYSTVCSQITSDKPIYAGWSWTSGGGHAVVICGFTNTTTNPNKITYMDPLDGKRHTMTFASFKGGANYDHVWDGTIYDF